MFLGWSMTFHYGNARFSPQELTLSAQKLLKVDMIMNMFWQNINTKYLLGQIYKQAFSGQNQKYWKASDINIDKTIIMCCPILP